MPETYYCSTIRTGKLMKVCQYVYMYNIIIFCLHFLNLCKIIYLKTLLYGHEQSYFLFFKNNFIFIFIFYEFEPS